MDAYINNNNIKAKQNEEVTSEKKSQKATKENLKKKRKAPDVPHDPKTKLNVFEVNGEPKVSSSLPIARQQPSAASCESLTSSSVSTDYSETSRSFTFSSFSSSVEIEENAQNLSVKSINASQVETLQEYDEIEVNIKHVSTPDLDKTWTRPTENEDKKSSNPEPNGCSNLSDYVEKAILVTDTDLLSSSPPKSAENVTELPVSHHHPPRLTSFESSSTLHHKGLSKLQSSSEVESGLKPRYVTLDFVKSAAAEDRNRHHDDEGAACNSNSSLSSSLLSSIDSDMGSTIGSDVVESLYNKITAASSNIKSKSALSPEVKTGDIEKDLFPLIFPGHHRQGVGSQGGERQLNSSLNNIDVIRPQHATTPANKSDDFHNFGNNKSNCLPVGDQSKSTSSFHLEDSSSPGLQSNEDFQNGLSKCDNCDGVIINLNQTIDERMRKAKEIFGQCFCNDVKEQETVTELDYGSFNLKEVPEEIYDYSDSLLKLSVESNTITELPTDLFQCHNLSYLSVSDNDIPSLPDSLASLVNLKYLDVSKNVIEDLPDCIRCCKNLEVLDTSVNPIEKLTEGLTQLVNLRELYMNDCFFDFLPASFGRMTKLQVLELRDNQLQILPKSMRRLSLLSRLDLGGNVFQDWPDVISKLSNLRELWLDCNELSQVPFDFGNLSQLTYLDLSRNFLESIPAQIGSLDQLTDLILAENTLTSLPDSIGFLYRLNVLNLDLNHINQLPDSFGKLRALEEVDLSHNKVEALPSTVGKLRNLHTLLLDDNELSEIPSELGSCTQLNILQLSRNKIDQLPNSMGNLANLRVLNICQNRISYLPISMMKLDQLEALWISPNQSKPNVPLQTEMDPNTGLRILTNVLFPQVENGPSRAMKLLGQPDEDDNDAYANDAADDDDLDAYARRERGRTHVMFDLHATTYSDQLNETENYEYEEMDNAKTDLVIPQAKEEDILDMEISGANDASPSFITEEDGSRKEIENKNEDMNSSSTETPHQDLNLCFKEEPKQYPLIENHLEKNEENGPYQKLSPDLENYHAPCHSPADKDMEIDCDHEIVIGSDNEDYPPPPKGIGLRTWSSRSNLPSALTEQTNEWNPDEDVTDCQASEVSANTQSLTDGCTQHTSKGSSSNENISNTNIVKSKCIGNTSLQGIEKNASFRRALAIDDDVAATSAEVPLSSSSMSSESKVKEPDRFSSSNDIPFMNNEGVPRSTNGELKGVKKFNVPVSNYKVIREADATDSIQTNDIRPLSLKKIFKNTDDLCLSTDYVIEGKASSMTSSEGAPGTDHDSGVGNDVESQESVMDVPEESLNHISEGASKPKTLNVAQSRPTNEGASVRRNKGGWIALVRSEKTSDGPEDPSLRIQTSKNVASSFDTNSTNLLQTRYVPASTMDTTKVTYSHEYHKTRSQDRSRNGSNVNRVADGIKKFENFAEVTPTTKDKPKIVLVANTQTTNSSRQSQGISTRTKKPMAIATILSTTVHPKSENEHGHALKSDIHKENYSADLISSKGHDNVSFESFNKTWDAKVFNSAAPTYRVKGEEFEAQSSNLDYVEDNSLNRRISAHVRKSKFDEALAATKHKHFRDKLEKMMHQQQKDQPDSKRKMSRGSTSSLASMPRITSPVPHHHSSSAFEKMTADSTSHHDEASTSRSVAIHSRLKEKLQSPEVTIAFSKPITSSSKSKPISRNRPGSARQIGQRGTSQRSSLRSRPTVENNPDKPKISLEEQLGQLLLEGSEERRFDPIMCNDLHQGLTRKQHTNTQQVHHTGKTIRPSDWKLQLLQYLERKKLDAGKISGTVSLGRSYNPEPQATSPTQAHSSSSSGHGANHRTKPHPSAIEVTSGLQYRHATSVPEINMQSESRKPEHCAKTQSASNFARASSSHSSRIPGRRSSGKYQRTRTPGPEMTSEAKQITIAVRPRSAMDMPSVKFEQVEPALSRSRDNRQIEHGHKERSGAHLKPNPVPPTYEDHVRRANAGAVTWNQQDYHDYVNVEYLNQIRASMSKKKQPQAPTAPAVGYPLRATGSHDSVLNQKNGKVHAHDNETFGGIKGSASHDSIIDNRQQPKPSHQYPYPVRQMDPCGQYGQHYQQFNYPEEHQYIRTKVPSQKRNYHEERRDYGEIPTPPKTTKKSFAKPSIRANDYRNRSIKSHQDRADDYGYPLPYCAYPLNPPVLNDGYSKPKRLSAAPQHGYPEREDESVASAFRPYHQHPNPRSHPKEHKRSSEVFDDYPVYIQHHPGRGVPHTQDSYYNHPHGSSKQASGHHRRQDHSRKNDQSLIPERKIRHWRESDSSVEIINVTVRKNPTFGFHIMGGTDAGGNPYRPEDDGVFITFVAPGGAADQLVQPGDKILLVNGSEFVGITHRRAVDLLRNAGHIAVLVVERLVGRPV